MKKFGVIAFMTMMSLASGANARSLAIMGLIMA